MDRLNDFERLRCVWRSLADEAHPAGWRTLSISSIPDRPILAGRHFPGNEEAILFGFKGVDLPPVGNLPRGHGFSVLKVASENLEDKYSWLALIRKGPADIKMFERMAIDLVQHLLSLPQLHEEKRLALFIARVFAWQSFMERRGTHRLSREAETGLFGELVTLEGMLACAMPVQPAVESWLGPFGSAQDFLIGHGAVEVKATMSTDGFPAVISSLEQLDDVEPHPIFIAAVRLVSVKGGRTLPELVAALREILSPTPDALQLFESRLIASGYMDFSKDAYATPFHPSSIRIFEVTDSFPRITRSSVDRYILSAKYELNLDSIDARTLDLCTTIERLGGI